MIFNPDTFHYTKYWKFPRPKKMAQYQAKQLPQYNNRNVMIVNQQQFYDEYFPSGHKIFDEEYFPNIFFEVNAKNPKSKQQGKAIVEHPVMRIAYPIQQMVVEVLLSQMFGNDVVFTDSNLGQKGKAEALSNLQQLWLDKNMATCIHEFAEGALSTGDAAVVFFIEDETVKWKVLSYLKGDTLFLIKDDYDKPQELVRQYTRDDMESGESVRCIDVIDNVSITTFVEKDGEWKMLDPQKHSFPFLPAIYYYRREGAVWTPVQPSIDAIELMVSRLSEDGRTKTKAKYYLKTENPNTLEVHSMGSSDLMIGTKDSDLKLVQGAEISSQFKFEYDTHTDVLERSMGIVFPKMKSSGDMPTGSMKILFYPAERVITNLIHEFNEPANQLAQLFLKCILVEYPNNGFNDLKVNAWIKVFTPQDDAAQTDMACKAYASGIVSRQTASKNVPFSANNEAALLKEQDEIEFKEEQKREKLKTSIDTPHEERSPNQE